MSIDSIRKTLRKTVGLKSDTAKDLFSSKCSKFTDFIKRSSWVEYNLRKDHFTADMNKDYYNALAKASFVLRWSFLFIKENITRNRSRKNIRWTSKNFTFSLIKLFYTTKWSMSFVIHFKYRSSEQKQKQPTNDLKSIYFDCIQFIGFFMYTNLDINSNSFVNWLQC